MPRGLRRGNLRRMRGPRMRSLPEIPRKPSMCVALILPNPPKKPRPDFRPENPEPAEKNDPSRPGENDELAEDAEVTDGLGG